MFHQESYRDTVTLYLQQTLQHRCLTQSYSLLLTLEKR